MDRDIVEKGLKGTASLQDKLNAFREAGLVDRSIAEAAGVDIRSVKRWRKPSSPHGRNRYVEGIERLDHLRAGMGALVLDRGVEPEEAALWMTAMRTKPPYVRPIEIVGNNPVQVLEMIEAEFPTQE